MSQTRRDDYQTSVRACHNTAVGSVAFACVDQRFVIQARRALAKLETVCDASRQLARVKVILETGVLADPTEILCLTRGNRYWGQLPLVLISIHD